MHTFHFSPERVTLKMNVRTARELHPDLVPKVMEFVVSVRIILKKLKDHKITLKFTLSHCWLRCGEKRKLHLFPIHWNA